MISEIVFERKGRIFTNSLVIAQKSEIQHESVVRLISNNEDDLHEFGPVDFSDLKSGKRGRPTRVYHLNEPQSTLILTYLDNTEPVKQFKKNLVKSFFEMAKFIQSLQSAKMEFPEFTRAIMAAHEEPKHYHYSNELNMINKIVLGVNAKQFKTARGIPDETSIRPYLTSEQIRCIERLQNFDTGLILTEPDFQTRKEILTRYYGQISTLRLVGASM